MRNTKYANFRAAVLTWLRSDTTLCSLVGHTGVATGQNNSILARSGYEQPTAPCLFVTLGRSRTKFPDVDDGIYITYIVCEAFAATSVLAMQIIGEVEYLARQNSSTYADATFATNNVKAMALRVMDGPDVLGMQALETVPNIYKADTTLKIEWEET